MRSARTIWLIGSLLLTVTSLPGLVIQETKWGFDGSAVPGRPAPLSVLVANENGQPYNGELVLYRSSGGTRISAYYVEPLYLAPFAQRWVQFYPIPTEHSQWRLRVGLHGRDDLDVAAPRPGVPATVLLVAQDEPRRVRAKVALFPEELFPTSVCALDSLGHLVMDHAPKWEAARRQALLDWVSGGGELHLLEGRAEIRLPPDLAELDSAAAVTTVGHGKVHRHQLSAVEATPAALGIPAAYTPARDGSQTYYYEPFSVMEAILQHLRQSSMVRHNWALIFAALVFYILLMVPLHAFLAKRWNDFRRSLGYLALVVLASTSAVAYIGRRGRGERSVVHSVTYARPLAAGSYDVTQFVDLFVTRGAQYRIAYNTDFSLFGVPASYEGVKGVMTDGPQGALDVEIPLNSARAFIHRARLAGPVTEVARVPGAGRGWDVTGVDHIIEAWLCEGEQWQPLQVAGSRLSIGDRARPLAQYWQQVQYSGPATGDGDLSEANARRAAGVVTSWALHRVAGDQQWCVRQQAAGDADLFVLAPMPPEFGVQADLRAHEVGHILYHFQVSTALNE